jgi:hypothetical protein
MEPQTNGSQAPNTRHRKPPCFAAAGSPRTSRFATVATIQKQKTWRRFIMSKIEVEYDLEKTLKSNGRVFVLFYAS